MGLDTEGAYGVKEEKSGFHSHEIDQLCAFLALALGLNELSCCLYYDLDHPYISECHTSSLYPSCILMLVGLEE